MIKCPYFSFARDKIKEAKCKVVINQRVIKQYECLEPVELQVLINSSQTVLLLIDS